MSGRCWFASGERQNWCVLLAGAALLGTLSCKSTPPPPPPPPTPTAETGQAPQAPLMFVKVIGNRLNVRAGASSTAAVVTKLKKGDRIGVLSENGGWFEVRLADGSSGWVSAQFVRKDLPCAPDKSTAEVLNDPPISLVEGAHGRIVVDATVNAEGVVTATKLIQNTTGVPELAQKAVDEVHQLKFAPPVRNCKPVAFVYTYTRSY